MVGESHSMDKSLLHQEAMLLGIGSPFWVIHSHPLEEFREVRTLRVPWLSVVKLVIVLHEHETLTWLSQHRGVNVLSLEGKRNFPEKRKVTEVS